MCGWGHPQHCHYWHYWPGPCLGQMLSPHACPSWPSLQSCPENKIGKLKPDIRNWYVNLHKIHQQSAFTGGGGWGGGGWGGGGGGVGWGGGGWGGGGWGGWDFSLATTLPYTSSQNCLSKIKSNSQFWHWKRTCSQNKIPTVYHIKLKIHRPEGLWKFWFDL